MEQSSQGVEDKGAQIFTIDSWDNCLLFIVAREVCSGTQFQCGEGFFHTSWTTAGHTIIHLNSDTVYPETASDFHRLRTQSVPQDCPTSKAPFLELVENPDWYLYSWSIGFESEVPTTLSLCLINLEEMHRAGMGKGQGAPRPSASPSLSQHLSRSLLWTLSIGLLMEALFHRHVQLNHWRPLEVELNLQLLPLPKGWGWGLGVELKVPTFYHRVGSPSNHPPILWLPKALQSQSLT